MWTNESYDNEFVPIITGEADGFISNDEQASKFRNVAHQKTSLNDVLNIDDINNIPSDIDKDLLKFNAGDTALTNLVLNAKKIDVNNPVIDDYIKSISKSFVITVAASGGVSRGAAILYLSESDANLIKPYDTLLVTGVNGYDVDGKNQKPGEDLMLFVTGRDEMTGCPTIRAINGKKNSSDDELGLIPNIPSGSKVVILSNALSETQKEVEGLITIPKTKKVYLQKRAVNQIVSAYFENKKKGIPFSQSINAENAIIDFKRSAGRTFWGSIAGKFHINVPQIGPQVIYTTKGIRWQMGFDIDISHELNADIFLGIINNFLSKEENHNEGILLAGNQLLNEIQTLDFSKYSGVQFYPAVNSLGYKTTILNTASGKIEIIHDFSLDQLGWEHSGALINKNNLTHYVFQSEKEFTDEIQGQEAYRSGLISWDAVTLDNIYNFWLNGYARSEKWYDNNEFNYDPTVNKGIVYWDKKTAPNKEHLCDGKIFYFLTYCPAIENGGYNPLMGEYWKVVGTGNAATWEKITESDAKNNFLD